MQLIPAWDHLPEMAWKDKIAYLTFKFLQLPQTDCPLEHIFEPGLYIRELKIPAGTLFIGRLHRHGHRVDLLSGSVIHITENGRFRVDAPFTVHTQPGYHMVAYIMTDVVCRSIHPNAGNSCDIEALELDAFEAVETLRHAGSIVHDRNEYLPMLHSYGIDESVMQPLVETEIDQIPFPDDSHKVALGDSRIHGTGLLAKHPIEAGDSIAIARFGEKRTPAGRYANHSFDPNAKMMATEGNILLVALKAINAGEEVTVDYRESIKAALSWAA